jgi:hypothetical protein
MADETTVLNDALLQIGADPITGIDDGTANANVCKQFYPNLRDALIRAHHWNFAMKRATLAADAVAPLFGFSSQFTLPADLLKIVEYSGGNPVVVGGSVTTPLFAIPQRYVIEERKLLTNDTIVMIVYLSRVTNPDLWDGLFYQLVTTWLASKLALSIAKDASKAKALLEMATNLLLPMASAVDGQEGTIVPYESDALTRGR